MKGVDEEGGGGAVVEAEAVETWLTGLACFSTGLPCLSKKVSAILATSSDVIDSTSFPIISLILGGIVLRRCSLRMSSTSTPLTSSVS